MRALSAIALAKVEIYKSGIPFRFNLLPINQWKSIHFHFFMYLSSSLTSGKNFFTVEVSGKNPHILLYRYNKASPISNRTATKDRNKTSCLYNHWRTSHPSGTSLGGNWNFFLFTVSQNAAHKNTGKNI